VWAKDFMFRHGIPTAKFNIVESKSDLLSVVKEYSFPLVIKMESLQGGKGVFICENKKEVESVAEKIYGELSGEKLLVEEFLKGVEASYMVFCDGKNYVPLPSSKDHKKIYEGEKGPNTGGMGAISPAPVMTDKVIEKAKKKVIEPVIKGLREEGIEYNGIIYAGLMVENESVRVLEFNVRLGDPETQSILTRLETDILDILYPLGKEGRLSMDLDIKWDNRPSVCVVMAQYGYPGKYEKGSQIDFSKLKKEKDVYVFHAGTSLKDGKILTNGGRVLNIVAISDTITNARKKAYEKVDSLKWEKAVFRKDIGL
jgi:phosphoribosylamine---glycine ligase